MRYVPSLKLPRLFENMCEFQQLSLSECPTDELHPNGQPLPPLNLYMGAWHHDSREPGQVDIHSHQVPLMDKTRDDVPHA